jgi:threonine synthase
VGDEFRVNLGEAQTPLVSAPWIAAGAMVKLEYLQPTGSYKDRGAALTMAVLASLGITECVEDSSGNAAAAMAAYATACGIRCGIYAPAGNSAAKLAQTRAFGAEVTLVDGDRQAVEDAVLERARDTYYVGHNWHPLFLAGISTLGIELVEQCGWQPPDSITLPIGFGNLFLGVWQGLCALKRDGVIEQLPQLHGVQVDAFPAVAAAWAAGARDISPVGGGVTVAEGIECRRPVRAKAVISAIRDSGGSAIAVSEVEVADALSELTSHGYYVEPTSAVALAGYRRLDLSHEEGRHVVILTGSGLKAPEVVERLVGESRRRLLASAGGPR